MRCSRTCSRSSATSRWASSSGPAATATCISNHLEQVDEQLARVPLTLPKLVHRAPAAVHFRLHVRGFSDRELPASPGHQGARRRMKAQSRRRNDRHSTSRSRSAAARRSRPRRSSKCAIRRSTAAACSPSRRIAKGTRIIEYLGDRISHEAADARYEDHDENDNHTFLFIVDKHTVIDAGVGGNDARFINHQCDWQLRVRHREPPRVHRRRARHRAGRGAGLRLRDRPRQGRSAERR